MTHSITRYFATANKYEPVHSLQHHSRLGSAHRYLYSKLTSDFANKLYYRFCNFWLCCCVSLCRETHNRHIKYILLNVKRKYWLLSPTASSWRTRHSTTLPPPPPSRTIIKAGRRRKATVPLSWLYPSRSYFPFMRVAKLVAALLLSVVVVRWEWRTVWPPRPSCS